MAESKYGKYICTELIPSIPLPEYREWERDMIGTGLVDGHRRRMEHLVWTDGSVIPGAFYSEIVWLWGQDMPNQGPRMTEEEMKKFIEANPNAAHGGPPPHAHPFPELLSFFGTDPENPDELGCEVEFWLEDEQYFMTKSFVVYIPANVVHCPLKMKDMTKGLFHYTIGPGDTYV